MRVVCFYFKKEAALKNIAEIFYRYTPQIALSEDALFLEVGQCTHLYTEEKFITLAQAIFSKLELNPQIGVASSIPLARAMACLGTQKNLPLSFLKHFMPFDPVEEKVLLKIQEYLTKLGIERIESFLTLSPRELSSRFGSVGLLLYHRVQDSSTLLWPKFNPEEKIIENREFDAEVELESVEPLLFLLPPLLDSLSLRLRARGKTLRALEVRLLQERGFPVYTIPIALTFTHLATKNLIQLFRDTASHSFQTNPLQGRVTGIELEATETEPYTSRQKDIFHPKKEENEENYKELVNRLTLRLGKSHVFKAALKESYLPEKNWERKEVGTAPPLKDPLPPRPLRVFPTPLPLPCFNGKIYFDGRAIPLENISQFEVLLSDWWDDSSSERTYFRTRSPLGQDLWLFRLRESYFLHGIFD